MTAASGARGRDAPADDGHQAVRIICRFPSDEEVVIALAGFAKKAIGDVFCANAAAREEAIAGAWLRQKGSSDERGR